MIRLGPFPRRVCAVPAWAFLATMLMLGGCSGQDRGPGAGAGPVGGALPRPDAVQVEDFAVDPAEVQLDSSVRQRMLRLGGGTPSDTQRVRTAAQVRSVATARLVQRIEAMGLPAAAGPAAAPGRRVVIVRGQVMDVDEGNRTRRTLIGFGAGKSRVSADVQVYYARPGAPASLLETFEADADSGHKPGLAVGMGAGAAAGRAGTSAAVGGGLHAASEARSGPAQEAERLADGVADTLQALFQRYGWVGPPANS